MLRLSLEKREEEHADNCRPRHVSNPSNPSLMGPSLCHNCITMTLSTGPHLSSARDMRIVLDTLIAEQASESLENCHRFRLTHSYFAYHTYLNLFSLFSLRI